MAGVGDWVWHVIYLEKKKITIQIFDKATSIQTIYKQSSGKAY